MRLGAWNYCKILLASFHAFTSPNLSHGPLTVNYCRTARHPRTCRLLRARPLESQKYQRQRTCAPDKHVAAYRGSYLHAPQARLSLAPLRTVPCWSLSSPPLVSFIPPPTVLASSLLPLCFETCFMTSRIHIYTSGGEGVFRALSESSCLLIHSSRALYNSRRRHEEDGR